jgi:hypothetical protein
MTTALGHAIAHAWRERSGAGRPVVNGANAWAGAGHTEAVDLELLDGSGVSDALSPVCSHRFIYDRLPVSPASFLLIIVL